MPVPSSASEPGPAGDAVAPGRFTRLVDYYGADGFARVRAARVAVIGLGGVGAHAALALARSGVGRLLLVDHDSVTVSSLNRSPVATLADVGHPKAEVLARHLAAACPDTAVEPRVEFCHDDTLAALLTPAPAVVVDAIDSLTPKLALLAHCVTGGLAIVSSMGASSRRMTAGLRIGDIAESRTCPLARRVRQRLRRRGIASGITCVWSEEPSGGDLPPDLGDRLNDRGRVRNRLPSQISLPGMFGYALAALALERIAGAGPGDR
ncbi:MAG: ThiF family adenylyltransferase [Candidatus Krumholzibacteriia bacterium]